MSKLEDAIHAAAQHGRLNGLTLWPDSQRGWQGNARWNGSEGWTIHIDADPVAALIGALQGVPNRDPQGQVPQAKQPAPTATPVLKGGLFD